ncbi:MAG: hypothetical protein WBQ23_06980 [Bacteroidota bacterium]
MKPRKKFTIKQLQQPATAPYDSGDFGAATNSDSHSMHYGRAESVFVVEPAVNVELNVTEWFRISAGASYRFVSGLNELQGIEDKDLSGPSGSLSMKFGAF